MGPAIMVEGKHKLDFGNKIIEFGAYTMVYTGTHNYTKNEHTSNRFKSVK